MTFNLFQEVNSFFKKNDLLSEFEKWNFEDPFKQRPLPVRIHDGFFVSPLSKSNLDPDFTSGKKIIYFKKPFLDIYRIHYGRVINSVVYFMRIVHYYLHLQRILLCSF